MHLLKKKTKKNRRTPEKESDLVRVLIYKRCSCSKRLASKIKTKSGQVLVNCTLTPFRHGHSKKTLIKINQSLGLTQSYLQWLPKSIITSAHNS